MSGRLTDGVIALALATTLFPAGPLGATQDPLLGWRTTGHTEALALVSVAARDSSEPSLLTLTFKNVSQKVIMAFSISGGLRIDVEYFDQERGLFPGDSWQVPAEQQANQALEVSAVLFEDGTYTGSASQARAITFQRMGLLVGRERVRKILEAGTTGALDDAALKSLRARLGQEPSTVEGACAVVDTAVVPGAPLAALSSAPTALRESFFAGFNSAKEEALRMIDRMGQIPTVSQHGGKLTRAYYWAHRQQQYQELERRQAQRAWHGLGGIEK